YWLAGADGGVYAFDAPFHGSLPGLGVTPAAPVVGIAADPGTAAGSTAGGYWLAGVDGGVYAFDAPFHGSDEASAGPAWRNPPAGTPVVAPCVAISSFAWGYLVAFGAETSPLGQAVTSYLASRAGNVTAAVYDELTGQTFVVNPSSAQDTASIVKVDILATALREAQSQGRFLTPGEESLAVPMIEVSDNAAATALWGDVGGAGGVSAFDRLVGMPGTTPNAAGYWGLTTTTAVDQVALLRDLAYSGAVLPAASRSYELSLMEHVTSSQAWGVSAGVAPGSTVALKNGWLPLAAGDWQVNSIGVVSGSGRSYAIAVLTTGDPSLGYGIQSISQVSQLVWGALGG
ncbi:MAG: serine hydrolase, partial [Acidimicrobiales bacterium]